MIKLIPLSDLVMVQVGELKKYEGKIIVPDSAQEQSQWASIVALGPDIIDQRLREGRQVIFAKYSGNEVEYEGAKYLLLHEREVLAILQELP